MRRAVTRGTRRARRRSPPDGRNTCERQSATSSAELVRRNKSTATFPRRYTAAPWNVIIYGRSLALATVPKRVEPTRLGRCVAPLDPRHRGNHAVSRNSTVDR